MTSTSGKKQGAIFQHPDPAQNEKVRFEEAFPLMVEVAVEVKEFGPGNEGLGTRRFSKTTVREFLNCSNPRCSGKGLFLGDLLREMNSRRETVRHVVRACQGQQEELKQTCPNHFHLHLEVRYKNSPQ